MTVTEGKGFLLRSSQDAPWAGWAMAGSGARISAAASAREQSRTALSWPLK